MENNFKIIEGTENLNSNLNRLLKTSNTASIFQSITFYEFFSNQPNTESFVFTISENEEIIASVFGVIIEIHGHNNP
jgi:hypothetical protein